MIACTFVPSIEAQDGPWQFVYALNPHVWLKLYGL